MIRLNHWNLKSERYVYILIYSNIVIMSIHQNSSNIFVVSNLSFGLIQTALSLELDAHIAGTMNLHLGDPSEIAGLPKSIDVWNPNMLIKFLFPIQEFYKSTSWNSSGIWWTNSNSHLPTGLDLGIRTCGNSPTCDTASASGSTGATACVEVISS